MNVEERVRFALESKAVQTPDGDPRGAEEAMRRGRRRRTSKRVGAAAVVVAGVVGFVSLSLSVEQPPAAQTPASTLPESVPTTVVPDVTPSTTVVEESLLAPITGITWERLDLSELDPPGEGGTNFILGAGDRFLYLEESGPPARILMHTSFDGSEWSTLELVGPGDSLFRGSTEAWQDRVVSICESYVGIAQADPVRTPVVWETPSELCIVDADGSYARVPIEASLTGVTIGEAGIIATGYPEPEGFTVLEEDAIVESLVLYDINEVGATRYVDGVFSIETPEGLQEFVLADHGILYLPNGAHELPDLHASWFTTDGQEWVKLPDIPIVDVIGYSRGFMAVTQDRFGNVEAWHSPDGLQWNLVGPLDALGFGGGLIRFGDQVIAMSDQGAWILDEDSVEKASPGFTTFADNALGDFGPTLIDGSAAGIVALAFEEDGGAYAYSDGNTLIDPGTDSAILETFENLSWPMSQPIFEVAATDTAFLIRLAVVGDPERANGHESVWFLGTTTRR